MTIIAVRVEVVSDSESEVEMALMAVSELYITDYTIHRRVNVS